MSAGADPAAVVGAGPVVRTDAPEGAGGGIGEGAGEEDIGEVTGVENPGAVGPPPEVLFAGPFARVAGVGPGVGVGVGDFLTNPPTETGGMGPPVKGRCWRGPSIAGGPAGVGPGPPPVGPPPKSTGFFFGRAMAVPMVHST